MLSSITIFTLLITMLVPFGMIDAYADVCVGLGSSVTIDNGLTPEDDGFFEVEVDGAGETDDVQLKPEGLDLDSDIMFETIMYYETDTVIESLSKTVTDGPCKLLDGSVESSGTFLGSDGDTIFWTANSSISPLEVRMETKISFNCPGCDENFDGLLRIHSYFDEDVGEDFGNCVLIVRGSAATNDLELFIIDLDDEYGVSQGGGFGDNLIGATFDGWAADQFSDLRNDIEDGTVIVSPTGVIDLDDLPAGSSPDLGDFNGPEDITTVMSYTLDDGATVGPLSFNLFTPAYAAGMASITFGLGGVPSSSTIPDDGPGANDHYLSYKAKQPKDTDKFEKITVTLSDQFETDALYTVDKPDRLYNPVQKTHDGTITEITDEISHYVGYKIKTPKGDEKFEKVTDVLVTNQFGDIIVDVKKAKLLLVPSAKDHIATPDPLDPVTVDHYKCYDVKVTKDTPKFEKLIVSLYDTNFEITQDFEIKKPKYLCTPVQKTHDGITTPINDEENHLLCYDVKKLKDAPKFEKRNVFTNNQFGPEELKVDKQEELCVPSIKTLP